MWQFVEPVSWEWECPLRLRELSKTDLRHMSHVATTKARKLEYDGPPVQSLEKQERKHRSSQAHVLTFRRLLHGRMM